MGIEPENIAFVAGGVLTGLHAGLLCEFSVDIIPTCLTSLLHL